MHHQIKFPAIKKHALSMPRLTFTVLLGSLCVACGSNTSTSADTAQQLDNTTLDVNPSTQQSGTATVAALRKQLQQLEETKRQLEEHQTGRCRRKGDLAVWQNACRHNTPCEGRVNGIQICVKGADGGSVGAQCKPNPQVWGGRFYVEEATAKTTFGHKINGESMQILCMNNSKDEDQCNSLRVISKDKKFTEKICHFGTFETSNKKINQCILKHNFSQIKSKEKYDLLIASFVIKYCEYAGGITKKYPDRFPDSLKLFGYNNMESQLAAETATATINFCATRLPSPHPTAAQARLSCEETAIFVKGRGTDDLKSTLGGKPLCTFTPGVACLPNPQAMDWCDGLARGTCNLTQLCEWDSSYTNPSVTEI